MLAAALYPFSRSYGIELAPELHRAGQALLANFLADVLPALPLYSGGARALPCTPPALPRVPRAPSLFSL
jgi:hypothetical protein